MAKPDGRVERGQSLKRAISATRWNDLCDAADIVHGRRGGIRGGEHSEHDTNMIRVRLASDSTFAVRPGTWVFMDLDGAGDIDGKPNKNSPRLSMFARPIADGGKDKAPSGKNNIYKFFGMARTGGSPGDIITVQVSGAVYCYVEIRHRWHGFATFPFSPRGSSFYGTSAGVTPEIISFPRPYNAVPESAVSGAMRLVWWDDTNFLTASASGTGLLCPAIVSL